MSAQEASKRSEDHADLQISEVAERYRPRIYQHVLAMVHDPTEAEDLTQETFIRAQRSLETLRDPDALTAWLYRLATNVCLDRFRAATRRLIQPFDPTGEPPGDQGIPDATEPRLDRVIEQAEMTECVQEYIGELPDDYRTVILLHDLHALTNPEIAEMLDCSLATVKIRVHRARERLRAALRSGCEFEADDRGVTVCEPSPADDAPPSPSP